jgi:alkylation response protein AidB-like acyl-CoA dehydrogenase
MDFDYPPQADVYRTKVRAFLDANLPKDWKGIGALNHKDAAAWTEDWREKLSKNGLLALTWPKEYGGQGLSHVESLVLAEEFALSGVPGGGTKRYFWNWHVG